MMTRATKDREIVESETKEVSPLSVIKTEVNLAGLPFFALARQDVRKKIQTEYITVVERDGKKLEVSWNVTANAKHGYPGPFDRKVHRAIEYIINERGIPIHNPIPFSMYQIIRILGLNSSGRTRQRIKQSLVRIFSASVTSEGTFYSRVKKQYISDNFHIYDRVVFKEQTMPNGETADTNYLFLSHWYLDSVNSFYLRPIDFSYLQQLRGDIAGRLYELLSLKFFGVILNRRPYWRVEYRELCDLLPIASQKYLSDAKRYLAPAHDELTTTRFLSRAVWDMKDKDQWYILYYPGKKAIAEARPRAVQEQLPLELPETMSARRGEMATEGLTKQEQELFLLLTERRIGQKSAVEIVRTYPDRIKAKIEVFDWAMKNIREKIQSPTGFLRRMIEEDWEAPEGFVSEAEQKRKGEEASRRTKAQEQRDKEEQFRRWCSMTPEQKVRGDLWLWEHGFAREQGRKPTAAEVKEKEQGLIDSLPSEEEYRGRVFGDLTKA